MSTTATTMTPRTLSRASPAAATRGRGFARAASRATRCAAAAPTLDINTKIFEKEIVDVAGEQEYIVRGG